VANQKKRRKTISYEDNGVELEDNDSMLKHAMDFYKTLFSQEPKEGISIGEYFWDVVDKISSGENEALEAEFSEEEIKKAVLDSYAEGALGLMVFPSSSTKSFGPLLRWT
jgi:hypothetical protein